MRYFLLACLTISLGLTACGSNKPFDVGGDPSPGDSASADASSGRGDTAAPVSGTSCLNRCNNYNDKAACQCDDSCVDHGDCCGDFIKQCLVEVKPDADAGSTSPEVAQTNCVDNDGDGYCDSAPKQGDCNDKDKTINPGATEKCAPDGTANGVDENCNGVADEGCKAASNPTPTSGTATVKLTYPTARFEQFLVHVWGGSKSFIFTGYEKVVNDTNTVFQATVQVDANACGLTIQAANGSSPATSSFWLCTGPGGFSSLDPAAELEVTYNGKTYYEADMVPLGAPGGGCAIVVQFKTASPCNL
ncbi:MAG: MopE-related protein [Candidatus Uhrbacteria bacterium]|nr:MopE-related protein [Candidatus Uhrbacteria bacterium]